MKKLLILLIFVLFSSSVYGSYEGDNLFPESEIWMPFNNTIINYGNGTQSPSGCSACTYFGGSPQSIANNDTYIKTGKAATGFIHLGVWNPTNNGGGGSVCVWQEEGSQTGGSSTMLGHLNAGLSDGFEFFVDNSGDSFASDIHNIVSPINYGSSGTAWQHKCQVWDNNWIAYYINGTKVNNASWGVSSHTGDVEFNGFGDYGSGNSGSDHNWDEYRYWFQPLDNDEILKVYQYEADITYELFTITADNTYFDNTLLIFNATVNNTLYETTNGTILTPLINENNLIDIIVYSNKHDTKIYSGYNVSNDLVAILDYYKYILNVTAKDQFNNIIPYNLSINSTLYETTNATVLYEGNKDTYYALEINKNGYNSVYDDIYLNWWITEYNYTLYWDHYKLNITANDFWGNPIQNFSITAVGSNTVAGSTTEFNTVLELNQNETYDIEIDANNYALDNISLSMDYWLTNHTFTLYTTNSINFSFFEEGTGYFLNNITVNIELISAAYSNNYSTSNGSLYVDLLSPSDYTARYSAPDYNENFYYFTLVNRTHSIIDLFLSVAAATTEITATVYDNTNNILEDVEIRAARYDIESNTYILVSECKTNFLGECKLNLVKNTEYYKFFLYYQGVLRKTTSPSYIYDNLLNFQISLEDPSGTDYYNSQKIVSALVFNAATNNFRFTFSDNTGIGSKFCLDVDKKTSLKTVAFNSSCTTGASGVILINIPEINGTTFSAIGTAYINEQPVFLNGLTKTWINTAPDSNLFMLFLIILTLLATFIFTFSITAGILVIPLPMVLFAVLGLVKIETGIAIGVEILALILAIILNRNG